MFFSSKGSLPKREPPENVMEINFRKISRQPLFVRPSGRLPKREPEDVMEINFRKIPRQPLFVSPLRKRASAIGPWGSVDCNDNDQVIVIVRLLLTGS